MTRLLLRALLDLCGLGLVGAIVFACYLVFFS
jgi:hypothetical protein